MLSTTKSKQRLIDELRITINNNSLFNKIFLNKTSGNNYYVDNSNSENIFNNSKYNLSKDVKYSSLSFCEKKIGIILIKNKIRFVCQKKFDGFISDKKEYKFDFYLPDYILVIEYDGEQHEKVINFSYSEKRNIQIFEETKRSDTAKNQYCIDKKINILRLNYQDYLCKRFETKIQEKLLEIKLNIINDHQ